MSHSSGKAAFRRRFAMLGLVPLVAVATLLGGCVEQPKLTVRVMASGLTIPWDLTFAPDGSMLFTERGGAIWTRHPDGRVVRVAVNLSDLFVGGETGLMGIVMHPDAATNRRVFTCQGRVKATGNDIVVVAWTLSANGESLTRVGALVSGLPLTSGRHGGCRLRFDWANQLWIGTGDAAVGTNPQDLGSLGGKVLRVDPITGAGVPNNPFPNSSNLNTRRIVSWGHRNVQGLALHPADGKMWTVEHGPDRDDEINRGIAGNFGWDPIPGYNEFTPMTDLRKFPNAVTAAWSSGFPTTATSGAAWLSGPAWKGWRGALAVANLKGSSLQLYQRDGNRLVPLTKLFDGTYGRLRTAQLGPNRRLYITTANGGGTDKILEVTPG